MLSSNPAAATRALPRAAPCPQAARLTGSDDRTQTEKHEGADTRCIYSYHMIWMRHATIPTPKESGARGRVWPSPPQPPGYHRGGRARTKRPQQRQPQAPWAAGPVCPPPARKERTSNPSKKAEERGTRQASHERPSQERDTGRGLGKRDTVPVGPRGAGEACFIAPRLGKPGRRRGL